MNEVTAPAKNHPTTDVVGWFLRSIGLERAARNFPSVSKRFFAPIRLTPRRETGTITANKMKRVLL